MQNEQQKWRTDKESEFEQQIKDISSKIDSEMNPEGDTLEDENKKLQEHYDNLVDQIDNSKKVFQQQLDEKDRQAKDMSEKVSSQ